MVCACSASATLWPLVFMGLGVGLFAGVLVSYGFFRCAGLGNSSHSRDGRESNSASDIEAGQHANNDKQSQSLEQARVGSYAIGHGPVDAHSPKSSRQSAALCSPGPGLTRVSTAGRQALEAPLDPTPVPLPPATLLGRGRAGSGPIPVGSSSPRAANLACAANASTSLPEEPAAPEPREVVWPKGADNIDDVWLFLPPPPGSKRNSRDVHRCADDALPVSHSIPMPDPVQEEKRAHISAWVMQHALMADVPAGAGTTARVSHDSQGARISFDDHRTASETAPTSPLAASRVRFSSLGPKRATALAAAVVGEVGGPVGLTLPSKSHTHLTGRASHSTSHASEGTPRAAAAYRLSAAHSKPLSQRPSQGSSHGAAAATPSAFAHLTAQDAALLSSDLPAPGHDARYQHTELLIHSSRGLDERAPSAGPGSLQARASSGALAARRTHSMGPRQASLAASARTSLHGSSDTTLPKGVQFSPLKKKNDSLRRPTRGSDTGTTFSGGPTSSLIVRGPEGQVDGPHSASPDATRAHM